MTGFRLYRWYFTLRLVRVLIRFLKGYTERVAAKIAATPYN